MKKIILLLAMFVSSLMVGQNEFEKFESKEGVESIIVTQKMFDLMSKVKVDAKDKEAQQYLNLLKKLDNLSAYYTSNSKLGGELNSSVSTYLKNNPLDLVSTTSQDGNAIKVYAKSNANQTNVKELLVVVNGDFKGIKTSVLSVKGDFPISDIAMLVKKLNIPVADVLSKMGAN